MRLNSDRKLDRLIDFARFEEHKKIFILEPLLLTSA